MQNNNKKKSGIESAVSSAFVDYNDVDKFTEIKIPQFNVTSRERWKEIDDKSSHECNRYCCCLWNLSFMSSGLWKGTVNFSISISSTMCLGLCAIFIIFLRFLRDFRKIPRFEICE